MGNLLFSPIMVEEVANTGGTRYFMGASRIIGIRELQEHAGEVIRQVGEEGQTIDISYGGAVVARLVPARQSPSIAHDDEAVWEDLERLSAEISAIWPAQVSAVDAVQDVRDATHDDATGGS